MARNRIDPTELTGLALEMIDTRGTDELTLAALAEELGVQSSALYTHIDGVDGLRQHLSVEATQRLGNCLRDAAVGRSGEIALRAVANAYRDFAERHPGQYTASLVPPDPTDPDMISAVESIVSVIARVLEGYGFEGDDAVHASRAVRSAIHGFVTLEAAESFTSFAGIDASFEQLLELLSHGLRR